MNKVSINIFSVLYALVSIWAVTSCSSGDNLSDDEFKIPLEEQVTDVVKQLNVKWGTPKSEILSAMQKLDEIGTQDNDIVEFRYRKSNVVLAYRFSSEKLCSRPLKIGVRIQR